jgi:hypothetical protein
MPDEPGNKKFQMNSEPTMIRGRLLYSKVAIVLPKKLFFTF